MSARNSTSYLTGEAPTKLALKKSTSQARDTTNCPPLGFVFGIAFAFPPKHPPATGSRPISATSPTCPSHSKNQNGKCQESPAAPYYGILPTRQSATLGGFFSFKPTSHTASEVSATQPRKSIYVPRFAAKHTVSVLQFVQATSCMSNSCCLRRATRCVFTRGCKQSLSQFLEASHPHPIILDYVSSYLRRIVQGCSLLCLLCLPHQPA